MVWLRSIHRFVTPFVVLFTLFLGVTGTMVQLIDLRSVLLSYPAADANVLAMREAFDGPGKYAVRQAADYDAAALPAGFDYRAALDRTWQAAQPLLAGEPAEYVEFRMAGARPVGRVGVGAGHLAIDAASGAVIERTQKDPRDNQSPESERNTFKRLHRMTTFGNWALYINVVVAAALAVLIVTGLWIYFKLLAGRRRINRTAPFWSGGGLWREAHRWTSVVAAAFLIVVTLSGAWLAVESLGMGLYLASHPPGGKGPPPPSPRDQLGGASLAQLDGMLGTTLAAVRADAPEAPVKVLRLRQYAGYLQGVVVTGGSDQRQRVYNAQTGAAMSTSEPGYPPVGFPFGWQAHQNAKSIHRGDFIGLSGRWMDLIAGLAMIYLSVSGIEMYWSMWRKRRQSGRKALFWK
jgi:uncharacterized iron-regulated membrane protein